MQRTILGILSAALLLGALITWLIAPDQYPLWGGMLRVGIVLGAIWIAIPNVVTLFGKLPPWLLAATFVGVCVMAWRPATILIVGPILAVLWVLVPRWFARNSK